MKRKLSRADVLHLHQLGEMKERRILTADEFAAQKAIVLDAASQPREPHKPTLWLVGIAVILLLVLGVIGISSGNTAAHELGRGADSTHH